MANGSGKSKRSSFRKNHDLTQRRQARTLDALAEYDKFTEGVLPKLKRAVLENWNPDRMRKEFAPLMQAIMIKKGAEGNFNALKDTLDRYEGMAIQRVEQKTVYKKMDSRELAALALQKLKDSGLITIDAEYVKVGKSEEESDT